MKLLSAEQIRAIDKFTIENEPISSYDLMERASIRCCDWILDRFPNTTRIHVLCGTGNNGGDGLAITRLLRDQGYKVDATIIELGEPTDDNRRNQERLENFNSIAPDGELILKEDTQVIIDAVFGTGLSRPVTGALAELFESVNTFPALIIAIDMPSGITDAPSFKHEASICADCTLTFQVPRLTQMLEDYCAYFGEVSVLDIGLSQTFIDEQRSLYTFVTSSEITVPLRPKISHKGDYGHGLLVSGQEGMMGAAVLSAKAALRSGIGKLTGVIPHVGFPIFQTAVPEAMAMKGGELHVSHIPEIQGVSAYAIGPGLGKALDSMDVIQRILDSGKPVVIDADALNIIAEHDQLKSLFSNQHVITPHVGEFDRLFGEHDSHWSRLNTAMDISLKLDITIVLKGPFTAIIKGEQIWFNSTGNPYMATAGSGDVLTGVILSWLARGMEPCEAAIIGVYEHGLAGDLAHNTRGQIIASDIIEYLGDFPDECYF